MAEDDLDELEALLAAQPGERRHKLIAALEKLVAKHVSASVEARMRHARTEDPDTVEARGPGGWGLAVKGRDALIVVMLAMALGFVIWLEYDANERLVAGLAAVEAGTRIGREAAVAQLSAEHLGLLCMLAIPAEGTRRQDALRSGDVCRYLLGAAAPGSSKR